MFGTYIVISKYCICEMEINNVKIKTDQQYLPENCVRSPQTMENKQTRN